MLVEIDGQRGLAAGGRQDGRGDRGAGRGGTRALGRGEPAAAPDAPVRPRPPARDRLLARLEGSRWSPSSPSCCSSRCRTAAGAVSTSPIATRTEALLSTEAARIAGHTARVRCDARGRRGGSRPACRRPRRGRRHERVPDPGHLPPALSPRVQGRRRLLQPDRAGDRRARARGVAPARRVERGRDELLRVPERRRAGASGSGSPEGPPRA